MILTDKLNVSYLPVGNSFRFSVTRSGRYGILFVRRDHRSVFPFYRSRMSTDQIRDVLLDGAS